MSTTGAEAELTHTIVSNSTFEQGGNSTYDKRIIDQAIATNKRTLNRHHDNQLQWVSLRDNPEGLTVPSNNYLITVSCINQTRAETVLSNGSHKSIIMRKTGKPLQIQIHNNRVVGCTKGSGRRKERVLNRRRKRIRTRVQRSVVLEDGKIVADTGPQICTKTLEETDIEDSESEGEQPAISSSAPSDQEEGVRSNHNMNTIVRKLKNVRLKKKKISRESFHYHDSRTHEVTDQETLRIALQDPSLLLEDIDNSLPDDVTPNGKLKFYQNKSRSTQEKEKITETSRLDRKGNICTSVTVSHSKEVASDDELPEAYDSGYIPNSITGSSTKINFDDDDHNNNYHHHILNQPIPYEEMSSIIPSKKTTVNINRKKSKGSFRSLLSPTDTKWEVGKSITPDGNITLLRVSRKTPSPTPFMSSRTSSTLGRPHQEYNKQPSRPNDLYSVKISEIEDFERFLDETKRKLKEEELERAWKKESSAKSPPVGSIITRITCPEATSRDWKPKSEPESSPLSRSPPKVTHSILKTTSSLPVSFPSSPKSNRKIIDVSGPKAQTLPRTDSQSFRLPRYRPAERRQRGLLDGHDPCPPPPLPIAEEDPVVPATPGVPVESPNSLASTNVTITSSINSSDQSLGEETTLIQPFGKEKRKPTPAPKKSVPKQNESAYGTLWNSFTSRLPVLKESTRSRSASPSKTDTFTKRSGKSIAHLFKPKDNKKPPRNLRS